MKVGVSSYSFSNLIREDRLALLAVPQEARELGFDVIEFSTLPLPSGMSPIEFAPRLKAACDEVGMPIANYTIGADFLTGSGGNGKAEAERLKTEVRVAKLLGAPGLRHDATRGFPASHRAARGFDDALPTLIRGCRMVTEFAADLGIRTMVENHGFFCQDSERVEKLVNGVNHPNFGWLVDIGNFLCADENPILAVARAMPHAFHVHVKDFHFKSGVEPSPGAGWFESRAGHYLRGAILGHGVVPVLHCLRLIKKAGFSGTLSLEFEGLEDPFLGIRLGHDNLRRFLAMV